MAANWALLMDYYLVGSKDSSRAASSVDLWESSKVDWMDVPKVYLKVA